VRQAASGATLTFPSLVWQRRERVLDWRSTRRVWGRRCSPDEAADGGLKIVDGSEDAALEAASGELGEEVFDCVEPGRRGCGEVECPTWMPGEPFAHSRMLVSGVVVDDGVDRFSCWHLRVEGIEEADELLVPVALHVGADDGAVEDVEAVNSVVVPMRLESCVIVPARPGFIGNPG
jgi:hypothetical protein